jgi:hypothetical protein
MENGTGNWTYDSPWNVTTKFAYSGNYSWTDSPYEPYQNSIEKSIALKIDLRTATMPVLSFWHRYVLEPNKDYGYVDVSGDAGQTWKTMYFVTGHKIDWKEEKIDLTAYALKEDVRIRFRLKTDGQNRYDGWYIDDVKIAETTAAIRYPFSDDMENVSLTEDNWISSSWEAITPHAHSGTRCWHDSPVGDMPAVRSHSSLTLAGTIDLSTAVNPQLTFWHHYALRGYDPAFYGYVEVSSNYGQSGTYTTLKTYRGRRDTWVQEQVDLSDYVGLSNVRIRFRLYNSGYSGYDGWYIDDVRIEDAPEDVFLRVPTNVTMHGADLSWSKNTEADFATYKMYRDTSSEVTRSDTLIATITDRNTTSYRDVYSILEPNYYYYYRVYVYDEHGMHSPGSNVVKASYPPPPKMSYPFFDDMGSGDGNWVWGSPWGLTTKFKHSGSYSWTDSPGTSYRDNVNTALEMRIDLRTATMPVLSFWHRYALEPNKDYGYVDVSSDAGQIWTTRYFVTGHKIDWTEEKIDLTEYALKEDVRIRFRLKTDGQNRYDGWYIDDVRIAETTAAIRYPFSDDMENVSLTEDNWSSSSWEVITPHAHSGTRCWHDSPAGDMPAVTCHSSLTVAGTIDLSTAVNPQLTFWHHYALRKYGYVEVSSNYGQSGTYTKLKTYIDRRDTWVQEQVDLSDYVGLSNVRIRFRLYNSGYSGYDGWYIDDVRIYEKGPVLCTEPDHDFGTVPEREKSNWTFNITNSGDGTLNWNITDDKPWITVSPANGETATEKDPVNVTVDTTGLECDKEHKGTVTIVSNGGTKNGAIKVFISCIGNPDLVITEKWVNWHENCTICYNVTNIGNGTAPEGHNTTLYVESGEVAHDFVPVSLAPGASYSGCFKGYNWTYTPPGDNITVCADSNNTLKESDETNNCMISMWMCGDMNCDEAVDMSDVIDLLYYVGYPGHYTICNEWAVDVNGDEAIDMSDVRALLNYVGYPGQYELKCDCSM